MSCPHLAACDFISHPPIYASLNSPLHLAIEKMKAHGIRKITVTDQSFSIIGSISRNEIAQYFLDKKIKEDSTEYKKLKILDVFNPESQFITAYLGTDVKEIRRILVATKNEYLPIAKNPWNKVLVGFVALKQIADIE